jgi:hypothetical protein
MHANGMHKNYAGTDVMSPDRTILSKIVRTYFACMHACIVSWCLHNSFTFCFFALMGPATAAASLLEGPMLALLWALIFCFASSTLSATALLAEPDGKAPDPTLANGCSASNWSD